MASLLRKLLIALTVSAGIAGLVLYHSHQTFLQTPLAIGEQAVSFVIEPGANVRTIAADMSQRGWLSTHPAHFEWLARSRGLATRIKAGEYEIAPGLRPLAALQQFADGATKQYRFTIIEGWTFSQFLNELQSHPAIVSELPVDSSAASIMARIESDLDYAEGWFLPDTYAFPRGTSDVAFLRRAHRAMRDFLTKAWAQRVPELPLESAEEALVLASIVEKETGVAEERGLIAGVFVERLRRKMRLQTDPTVIYGLGESFDGDLRYRDLRTDTPYNTYTRAGLPPTPIALPGRDAIRAAVDPQPTKALYFVARGDGTHQFSETLAAHNRAVRKYQLKR